MRNKQIKLTIFCALSLIHLIMGLSYFEALGDCSEFASTLLRIGAKITLTFLAFLFPGIIILIFSLLYKDITKATYVHIGIMILLSGVSLFVYHSIARYTIYPKQYLTQDEYMNQQSNKDKEIKFRADKLLKNVKQFTPPDSIQGKDKIELEKIVRREWDNFYSPLMRTRPECEPLLGRINSLTNSCYDFIEKDSVIELRKRTTQASYVLYSPGYHYFIAILTYELSKNPVEKYSYITLLCQRIKGKIYSYAFTGHIQSGGYGTSPTREGAVYRGLSDAFFYYGKNSVGHNDYGFGRELLKLQLYENPPSLFFWMSKGVRDLFQHKNDTILQYKYPFEINPKDTIKGTWYIWVYKN